MLLQSDPAGVRSSSPAAVCKSFFVAATPTSHRLTARPHAVASRESRLHCIDENWEHQYGAVLGDVGEAAASHCGISSQITNPPGGRYDETMAGASRRQDSDRMPLCEWAFATSQVSGTLAGSAAWDLGSATDS
jgi:hypothetical protein